MKKSYLILAIIAGALLGALQLQAKGLLGVNYVEVNGSYSSGSIKFDRYNINDEILNDKTFSLLTLGLDKDFVGLNPYLTELNKEYGTAWTISNVRLYNYKAGVAVGTGTLILDKKTSYDGWGASIAGNFNVIKADVGKAGLDLKFNTDYTDLSGSKNYILEMPAPDYNLGVYDSATDRYYDSTNVATRNLKTALIQQDIRYKSDMTRWDIDGAAVAFYNIDDNIKPFLSATLGYGWWDGKPRVDVYNPVTKLYDINWVYHNKNNTGSFFWKIGVGCEFGAANNFSITPYVNYQDYTTGNSNDWVFGLGGSYWFNENINVGLDVSYAVEDELFKVAAAFRYGW